MDIQQAAFVLGKVNMSETEQQSILALAQKGISDKQVKLLKDYAAWNKVIPQFQHNLSTLQEHLTSAELKEVQSALQNEYERRRDWCLNVLPPAIKKVAAVLEQNGIEPIFIKGSAIHSLYPADTFRQMNDLDMLVPSLSDRLKMVTILKEHGYVLGGHHWIVESQSRLHTNIYDHSVFLGETALLNYEEHVAIDVHSFAMAIGLSPSFLDIPLWARRIRAETGAYIPSAEDSLLIVLIHAVLHGFFLQKDMNDTYVLLSSCRGRFDWEYFLKAILDQNPLAWMARILLQGIRETYDQSLVPMEVIHQLPKSRSGSIALKTAQWLSLKPGWFWQWLSQVLIHTPHILAFERRRHSLTVALRAVWQNIYELAYGYLLCECGDARWGRRLLHKSKHRVLATEKRRGNQINLVSYTSLYEASPNVRHLPWNQLSTLSQSNGHLCRIWFLEQNLPVLESPEGWQAIVAGHDLLIPSQDAIFFDQEYVAVGEWIKCSLRSLQELSATLKSP